jgi:hypothetical protein
MKIIESKRYKNIVFEKTDDLSDPNIYVINVWQNNFGVSNFLMKCFAIMYDDDIHSLYLEYLRLIEKHLNFLKDNLNSGN